MWKLVKTWLHSLIDHFFKNTGNDKGRKSFSSSKSLFVVDWTKERQCWRHFKHYFWTYSTNYSLGTFPNPTKTQSLDRKETVSLSYRLVGTAKSLSLKKFSLETLISTNFVVWEHIRHWTVKKTFPSLSLFNTMLLRIVSSLGEFFLSVTQKLSSDVSYLNVFVMKLPKQMTWRFHLTASSIFCV